MTPYALREYHDPYTPEDGGWRIASRETRFVFRSN